MEAVVAMGDDHNLVCEARYVRLCEAIAELAIHAAPDLRTLHSVMLVVHHDPPSIYWYLEHPGVFRTVRIFGCRNTFRALFKLARKAMKEVFHVR